MFSNLRGLKILLLLYYLIFKDKVILYSHIIQKTIHMFVF